VFWRGKRLEYGVNIFMRALWKELNEINGHLKSNTKLAIYSVEKTLVLR